MKENNITDRISEMMDNKRWRNICEELELGVTILHFKNLRDIDSFMSTAYQLNARMYEKHFKCSRNFREKIVKVTVGEYE